MRLPLDQIPTPCYVLDEGLLRRNLDCLASVRRRTGAKIILALKGFAMFSAFPLIREVLDGTTASSLNEAILGSQEFGKEVHVYAVAYRDHQFEEILLLAHHVTFNSLSQWERFRESALAAAGQVSFGLRVNPGYSEVATEIYNPCRPGSRFGVSADRLAGSDLDGLDGLHFHSLCEQGSDVLERTLRVVERDFAERLRDCRWLNMGGGHHISRPDYDIDRLCRCIDHMQSTYDLEVILEPGEAVALNAGYLVSSVLDLFASGDEQIAVLDTSATAHMPDVLEMPYRPVILGAGAPGEHPHTYTLGGLTCLAGDVIGAWSFPEPLRVGDRLVFTDMAHYTMVKNTAFNGVDLPSIALYDPEAERVSVVREFDYEDYRSRLS